MSDIETALQLLRKAHLNMNRYDFLHEVSRVTEDANVAVPLMLAGSRVSLDRLEANAKRGSDSE
jgi:hypothetical protein